MVEARIVNKYVFDGTSGACFEYVGEQEHCNQSVCFHCKCEKCGKLIHLQCNELEYIQKHMLERHGFDLDSLRTVFYGICDQCKTHSTE